MNHKAMELWLKTASRRQFGGDGSNSVVTAFLNAAASTADKVLVPRHIARRLEAAEPFAEITFDYQTALHQHVESAIDRRDAGLHSAIRKLSRDLFGGQVLSRREQHLGDGHSLRSDREAALAQPAPEPVGYGVVCHVGSATSACNSAAFSRSGSTPSPVRC